MSLEVVTVYGSEAVKAERTIDSVRLCFSPGALPWTIPVVLILESGPLYQKAFSDSIHQMQC